MSFGFEIPGFSLLRKLGAEGPTPVFLADQQALERQAVVRLLPLRQPQSGPDISGSDLSGPFEQEGRLLARLQHRNIVRIYQIGATRDLLYRAMEFLGGGSLSDRVRAGTLTPLQAADCCAQLARALQVVHAEGACHHDLRPSHVLFRDERTPVLVDLGMVRDRTLDPAEADDGKGSQVPRWRSPEQLQGAPPDARSKVYVLGLLLHFMLTGKPAPAGDRLAPLPAEVAVLQPVLARMLAQAPDERYPDMQAVQGGLSEALPLPSQWSPAPPELAAPAREHRGRWRNWLLAGAPLVVAAAIAAWLLLPRGPDAEQLREAEQALRDFDTYMARMDIYGPAGANATDAVERMLATAPEHPGVRQAAERLAAIYLQDAYDSHLRNNDDDALRLAEKGLSFTPGHAELIQLRDEAQQALAASELQELLARGEAALARQDLLPPARDNAYDAFMQARALDPGNQAADAGLREIQLRIAEQARSAWGAEGTERARGIAAEGLALFPESVLLNDLLADLERAGQAN